MSPQLRLGGHNYIVCKCVTNLHTVAQSKQLWNICVTDYHGNVVSVVVTFTSSYHLRLNKSNTMDATSGAGTANHSRAPFSPFFL